MLDAVITNAIAEIDRRIEAALSRLAAGDSAPGTWLERTRNPPFPAGQEES